MTVPQIVVHQIRNLPTQYGMSTFTDLVFLWHGEHYGSRHQGSMTQVEAQTEALHFARRRKVSPISLLP